MAGNWFEHNESRLFGIIGFFFMIVIAVLGSHAWMIWEVKERIIILETLTSFDDRIDKLERECYHGL